MIECYSAHGFLCIVVDDWEAIGCFYDHDHSAIPDYFYTPSDLDFNELWPNVRPLVQACSKEAEKRNFTCFGIQFHQECWGGELFQVNASLPGTVAFSWYLCGEIGFCFLQLLSSKWKSVCMSDLFTLISR